MEASAEIYNGNLRIPVSYSYLLLGRGDIVEL